MPGPYDSFVRDALPPASLQPDFLFELPEHAYPERLNAAAGFVKPMWHCLQRIDTAPA